MPMLDIRNWPRARTDALEEVFDMRAVALSAVGLVDDLLVPIEGLPSVPVSPQEHEAFRAEDLDFGAVEGPIGKRIAEAIKTISCMSSSPCPLVDVKTLAPAADAPQHADMAECSDSTVM